MNINQDKRVKETTHPRPINAIPPTLWMQAAIITLGAFATMLSSTMLSAALPAMAAGLGVTDTAIQWIATAYLMALAAGVPLSAWAARRFGATQLWLYGLILFAIFRQFAPFPRVLRCCLPQELCKAWQGDYSYRQGKRSLVWSSDANVWGG